MGKTLAPINVVAMYIGRSIIYAMNFSLMSKLWSNHRSGVSSG